MRSGFWYISGWMSCFGTLLLLVAGVASAETLDESAAKAIAKPTVSEPLVAVSPTSWSRVHLDVGVGGLGLKASEGASEPNREHTSVAFTLGYEYAGETFGFNMRFPIGLAMSKTNILLGNNDTSNFVLGDVSLRMRWRALNNHKSQSYLSLGMEITLPFSLLQSLGGKRVDIAGRRRQEPLYIGDKELGFNLMPIRYLTLGPQLAFAQKVQRLTLGVHIYTSIIIAAPGPNWYGSPNAEFILAYDVYAVYDILGNNLIEAVVEFGGCSALTQIAERDYNDNGIRRDGTTGLTLTVGARSRFAKRFEALLGVQFALPVSNGVIPANDKRGYDFTAFYRHDWSLLIRLGVLL